MTTMEQPPAPTPPAQPIAAAAPLTTPYAATTPIKNDKRAFLLQLFLCVISAFLITPFTYRFSHIIIEAAAATVYNREYITYRGATLSPVALFTRLSEDSSVDEILIDSGDFVAVLPDNIGNITSTKKLYIFHNPIRVLPRTVGNLITLEHINIQNTRLGTLPKELAGNTDLSDISLQGNRITRLPDIFGSLQKLQVLNLSYNNIAELPPSIGRLPNLAMLDLTGNKLTKIPDNLPPNLEFLYLGGNPIPMRQLEDAQLQNRENNLIIFY